MFRRSCPPLPCFESRYKIYQCYLNVISVLTFIFINQAEHVTHPVVREPFYFPLLLLTCRAWVLLNNYSNCRTIPEHAIQTAVSAQLLTNTSERFLLVLTFAKTTLQYSAKQNYLVVYEYVLTFGIPAYTETVSAQNYHLVFVVVWVFFLVHGSQYWNRDKNCSCIISNLSQLSDAVKCCCSF